MPAMHLPQLLLSPELLREMMSSERGEIISRKVGRELLYYLPAWIPDCYEELASLLGPLVEELRERLHSEGIDRNLVGEKRARGIPGRLREDAAAFGGLIAFYALIAGGDPADRDGLLEEGIALAQISGDLHQEAILRTLYAALPFTLIPDEKFEEYRKAIDVAVRADQYNLEMDLRFSLIELLLQFDRLEEFREELGKVARIADTHPDEAERRFLHYTLLVFEGDLRTTENKPLDAAILYQQALRNLPPERDIPDERAPLLFNLSNVLHLLGQSRQAITRLLDYVDVGLEDNRSAMVVRAYARIGEIYLEIGELEESQNAFDLARRYLPTVGLKNAEDNVLMRQLPLFLRMGEYENGIEAATRLLESPLLTASTQMAVRRNLGLLLEAKGELERAENVLREGFAMSGTNEYHSLSLGISFARVLQAGGKSAEAGEILRQIIWSRPFQQHEISLRADALELLAMIDEERGDLSSALVNLHHSIDLRREQNRTELEAVRHNAHDIVEQRLRESNELFDRKTRHRHERNLAEVLTALNTSRISFQSIRQDIVDNLNWLSPKQVQQVVEVIVRSISDPETLSRIEEVSTEVDAVEQLETIDESFFNHLDRRWPGLTLSQKQLCGMIRAGLTTEEIATLMQITRESVWTKRKRLRKKLKLDEEESLEKVIGAIDG